MKPKIAILIVVWNGVKDTLECLESLQDDLYENKEIIIVDNGSTDDSCEIIKSSGFNVKIIRSESNLGFTGGNNLGLKEAKRCGAQYVFLLNNDTTVEPEALSALVEAAQLQPRAGILSPVIHYYDSPAEIWFAGATLRFYVGEALHDLSLQPGRLSKPYFSPWVSGCAMLVSMVAVDRVGSFDDRFYLNWEDVDWCVRMRSEGWDVGVVPSARIYHKVGRSQWKLHGRSCYYSVRNNLLFSAKHAGLGYLSTFVLVMWRHFREVLRRSGAGRREILDGAINGFSDHLAGHYGCRSLEGDCAKARAQASEPSVSV
jgi:GT2 family glycosyltransferase